MSPGSGSARSTPTYSSWINQVERFFAFVTADLLQRSDHRSVQALEADIRKWVASWNGLTSPTASVPVPLEAHWLLPRRPTST